MLTRIYQTQDPTLVDKIVLTTNNQNQISSRDLRANDPIQIDMERAFFIYGYYYERKPRQFDGKAIDLKKLFTNEYVAQAYLAIVLRMPSDGRARKYKVWGESHARIFSGGSVEPYIISAIIASRVADWLRASGYTIKNDELDRLLAKRGSFHVARAAACLCRGTDVWFGDQQKLAKELEDFENNPKKLEDTVPSAFELVVSAIKSSQTHAADVDRALKSSVLDKDIDKRLHSL